MFSHSTLNALFALVATMTLLTDSVAGKPSLSDASPRNKILTLCSFAALPTRRSTSSFSRRAQQGRARRSATISSDPEGKSLAISATSPITGKTHSIVIDAGSMGAGGITGSTINIVIHGKRNATAAPVAVSPPVEEELPSVESTSATPADSANHHNVHIDASGADGGIHNSTLNINLIGTGNARRSTSAAAHILKRSHATASTAWMNNKRMIVQPAKRQQGFVTDLAAQESAYAKGVAALSDSLVMPTPTARSPVVGAVKLGIPTPVSSPAPVAPRPTPVVPVVVPTSIKATTITKVTLVPAATGLGYFSASNPKSLKSRYIPSRSAEPKFPLPSPIVVPTVDTPQAALNPQEWRIVA